MARQASRRVGGGREQGPAVAAADTHTPESSSCNYLAAAAAAADCFSLSDSATLHAWKHRQRSVCKSALGHMPPDSLPRRRRSRRRLQLLLPPLRLLPLQQIHAQLPGLDAAAPSSIAIAAVWSTADSTGSPSGCSSCSTGSCCLAEVPAGHDSGGTDGSLPLVSLQVRACSAYQAQAISNKHRQDGARSRAEKWQCTASAAVQRPPSHPSPASTASARAADNWRMPWRRKTAGSTLPAADSAAAAAAAAAAENQRAAQQAKTRTRCLPLPGQQIEQQPCQRLATNSFIHQPIHPLQHPPESNVSSFMSANLKRSSAPLKRRCSCAASSWALR